MNHKCSCIRKQDEWCICTRQLHLNDTTVILHRLGTPGPFYVVFTKNREYRFILSPLESLSIYNNLACIIEYIKHLPTSSVEEQIFVWREDSLTLHVVKHANSCQLEMIRRMPFYRDFNISLKSLVAVFYFLQSVLTFTNPVHHKYIRDKMKSG